MSSDFELSVRTMLKATSDGISDGNHGAASSHTLASARAATWS